MPGRTCPPVYADRGMLRQAILNLALNACRRCPAAGRCRSSRAGRPGGWWNSPCATRARASPPEHLARIFDLYFTTQGRGQRHRLVDGVSYGSPARRHHRGGVDAGTRHDLPAVAAAGVDADRRALMSPAHDAVRVRRLIGLCWCAGWPLARRRCVAPRGRSPSAPSRPPALEVPVVAAAGRRRPCPRSSRPRRRRRPSPRRRAPAPRPAAPAPEPTAPAPEPAQKPEAPPGARRRSRRSPPNSRSRAVLRTPADRRRAGSRPARRELRSGGPTDQLARVNVGALSTDARPQYDTARRFIDQAEGALKARNYMFAGLPGRQGRDAGPGPAGGSADRAGAGVRRPAVSALRQDGQPHSPASSCASCPQDPQASTSCACPKSGHPISCRSDAKFDLTASLGRGRILAVRSAKAS